MKRPQQQLFWNIKAKTSIFSISHTFYIKKKVLNAVQFHCDWFKVGQHRIQLLSMLCTRKDLRSRTTICVQTIFLFMVVISPCLLMITYSKTSLIQTLYKTVLNLIYIDVAFYPKNKKKNGKTNLHHQNNVQSTLFVIILCNVYYKYQSA